MARIASRLEVHRTEIALTDANRRLSELADQNYTLYEQARRDVQERAHLLRELDHRVRNNLSVMLGLVSMERSRRPPRDSAEALETLESRMRSFLLVHEALRRENYLGVPVRDFVGRLTQRLRNAHALEDRIHIDIDTPDVAVRERDGFALALILNELLTNTFRHALSGRSRGPRRRAHDHRGRGGTARGARRRSRRAPAGRLRSEPGSGRSIVNALARLGAGWHRRVRADGEGHAGAGSLSLRGGRAKLGLRSREAAAAPAGAWLSRRSGTLELPVVHLRDVLPPLLPLRVEEVRGHVLAQRVAYDVVLLQLVARLVQVVRQVVDAQTAALAERSSRRCSCPPARGSRPASRRRRARGEHHREREVGIRRRVGRAQLDARAPAAALGHADHRRAVAHATTRRSPAPRSRARAACRVDQRIGHRAEAARVPQQPADVVQRSVRDASLRVRVEERVLAVREQRLVRVHAAAVLPEDRLRHERRDAARTAARRCSRRSGTSRCCPPSSARRRSGSRSRAARAPLRGARLRPRSPSARARPRSRGARSSPKVHGREVEVAAHVVRLRVGSPALGARKRKNSASIPAFIVKPISAARAICRLSTRRGSPSNGVPSGRVTSQIRRATRFSGSPHGQHRERVEVRGEQHVRLLDAHEPLDRRAVEQMSPASAFSNCDPGTSTFLLTPRMSVNWRRRKRTP